MGRPKKENPLVVLAVRVEPREADRAAELALGLTLPQSALLRLALRIGLDELERQGAPDQSPQSPKRATKRGVLAALRELAPEHGGLVPLPVLRHRFVDAHGLDAALLALEEQFVVDLKVANDPSQINKSQAIRRGESWLFWVVLRDQVEPAKPRRAASLPERIEQRMPSMVDDRLGLIPLPKLVQSFVDEGCTVAEIHRAILSLESVELRPESGMGRLSKGDAALCPREGEGVPLSWARIR